MRLFVGIDLPESCKSHIYEYLKPFQQSPKGWEASHDYHQTLLFVGEASQADCDEIKYRMDEIFFPPFELTTDGFKFFNRRIMYLGFRPSPELMQLKNLINMKLPEWVKPETKEYIPHVTVKRWQRYEYDYLHQNISQYPFINVSFPVNKISLFHSQKDELNRKYHVIYQSNLSKS